MIDELIECYIKKKNILITSSSQNGASSFTQFILNEIAADDELIVFFNPSKDLCREFTLSCYPRIAENVLVLQSPLENLVDFLESSGCDFDYLVVDPGDTLMDNKSFFTRLARILNSNNTNLICTSQMRVNPNNSKPYSTLEEFNKKNSIFEYSIWIRKSTGPQVGFIEKYIDVFHLARTGNKYQSRYIAKFTQDGKVFS